MVGAEDCNKFNLLPFAGVRALSLQRDPARAPAPFDLNRDGFVGTGGAVALVLEEMEAARARGATIYAEMLGWGEAADGYSVMVPEPEGEGLARAMENALAEAGVKPGEVDYINAHATGTTAGDLAEMKAIRRVFGAGGRPLVSSTKALTGHGLCLAGAMEAAFTVLALHESSRRSPRRSRGWIRPAPGRRSFASRSRAAPEVALSNSSGFGGANVSLVLARADARATRP